MIWSFFGYWIFSIILLVLTTHLICWIDFAFESIWSVCIFVFCLCVYVYILCMYLSFAEINAICFILFYQFCILWLGFYVCVVDFNILLNEMISDMKFSELCFLVFNCLDLKIWELLICSLECGLLLCQNELCLEKMYFLLGKTKILM